MDVVESGVLELQRGCAIDTAPAAVTQRGALDRSLVWARIDAPALTLDSGNAGKGDAVTVSMLGQVHLAEKATRAKATHQKATPRDGTESHRGVQREARIVHGGDTGTRGAVALASRDPNLVLGSLCSSSSVTTRRHGRLLHINAACMPNAQDHVTRCDAICAWLS